METKMNNISLKLRKANFNSIAIKKSQDAADYITKNFYGDDIELFESFFLLLLNNANYTTGYVKISQGGVAGTVVDPKIVAKYAIDSLSSAVIISHNHPSGNINPSEADKRITLKIRDGLQLFDIKLLDSLIITPDNYYSLADNEDM